MRFVPVCVLTAIFLGTSASAQIVSNGSFETFDGVFGGDGGSQLLTSSTTLPGWTIVDGEIAILKTPNIYNLTASDGNQFLDLTGYTNAGFPKGISQPLTGLTVGDWYTFKMNVGVRYGPCVGGGDNCHGPYSVMVKMGSGPNSAGMGSPLEQPPGVTGNVWNTFEVGFMADSPTMLLMISAVSSAAGNEYIGVDNVSVTEGITVLPEPATYATLLAGLVAVSFAARHRKNELRHRPTCLR